MGFFGAMFGFLGQIFGAVLWFFFDAFNNYTLAVVCLVLLTKILMFPLELKGRKGTAKTQKLQAKSAEIRKKYANDKQKQSEEMAKLYQREGANPGSGCWPQIFPMLSFFGVYYAVLKPLTNMFRIAPDKVQAAIEMVRTIPEYSKIYKNELFSQIEVVKIFPQAKDVLTMFSPENARDIMEFNKGFHFLNLDLFALPLKSAFLEFAWIWPVLCVLTMLAQTVLMQKLNKISQPIAGPMRIIPYLTPLIILWIVLSAPAALSLYYVITNILTVVQLIIMWKFFNIETLCAREEAARIALREQEEALEIRT